MSEIYFNTRSNSNILNFYFFISRSSYLFWIANHPFFKIKISSSSMYRQFYFKVRWCAKDSFFLCLLHSSVKNVLLCIVFEFSDVEFLLNHRWRPVRLKYTFLLIIMHRMERILYELLLSKENIKLTVLTHTKKESHFFSSGNEFNYYGIYMVERDAWIHPINTTVDNAKVEKISCF